MSETATERPPGEAVADYKRILKDVLDNRPSGTRRRLATALGKNRSFISQIANPAYLVPIPAQHLDVIFEICHFAVEERRSFLAAYAEAHPRRRAPSPEPRRVRKVMVSVPDFGSARKNRAVDELVADFARRLGRFAEDWGED